MIWALTGDIAGSRYGAAFEELLTLSNRLVVGVGLLRQSGRKQAKNKCCLAVDKTMTYTVLYIAVWRKCRATLGPLAQLAEHLTFNQRVPRSSRGWLTSSIKGSGVQKTPDFSLF